MCSEATVNRKLSAISAFYEFHQRHGVDLGDLLTAWHRRGTHGGSWRPLLAHLGSRPERTRRIRLRAERCIPDTLDGEQVATIVAACDRLRDRFLFVLLALSGLRVGEVWGCGTATSTPQRSWCRWSRGRTRTGRGPRAEAGRCRCRRK